MSQPQKNSAHLPHGRRLIQKRDRVELEWDPSAKRLVHRTSSAPTIDTVDNTANQSLRRGDDLSSSMVNLAKAGIDSHKEPGVSSVTELDTVVEDVPTLQQDDDGKDIGSPVRTDPPPDQAHDDGDTAKLAITSKPPEQSQDDSDNQLQTGKVDATVDEEQGSDSSDETSSTCSSSSTDVTCPRIEEPTKSDAPDAQSQKKGNDTKGTTKISVPSVEPGVEEAPRDVGRYIKAFYARSDTEDSERPKAYNLTDEDIKRFHEKYGFSESEILEFEESFLVFDLDGDGHVTVDELGTVMAALRQRPSLQELEALIRGVDKDNSGTVDFDEFLAMMSKRMHSDPEEELKEVFQVFDADGDGFICAVELYDVLSRLDEAITREEVDGMIKEADTTGDSLVNFSEFQYILRAK